MVFFILFYHRIFDVTFDENFARATGTKVDMYNLIIAVTIAVIIVLAMNPFLKVIIHIRKIILLPARKLR